MRSPSFGRPFGTAKIYESIFARAECSQEVSRSSKQLRVGETEDWFKAAKQDITMIAKEKTNKQKDSELQPLAAKVSGSGKKSKTEDTTWACCGASESPSAAMSVTRATRATS